MGLEVYECLKSAEQVRLDTHGAFDINYLARPRAGGPKGRKRVRPGKRAGNPCYELSSGPDGYAICLPESADEDSAGSLDLDLGGIGKGYALDRAVAVLADWTVDRALVHSGTSTAVAVGSAPGLKTGEEGWPVGVGGKWTAVGSTGRVLLRNRAISGSGTEVKGRHILDPGTGRKAQSHLAAWVSHPSAAIADALSTAFMVMGRKEVGAYCARRPEVWALVITITGKPASFNSHILSSPSLSPAGR
jgi:thiamine biosynthesis lipoprotein